MKNLKISVIMPVFNNETFVKEAIHSILEQSFTDFEFIIVDDNSTDGTASILEQIRDNRIIRINNTKHTGNYKCRNQGVDIAKAKYICVMDSDDLATPNRLLEQYEFMESTPECMVAGSDIYFFGKDSNTLLLFERLHDLEALKVALLKNNVCTHPSLIIRNEVFKKHGIRYNEEYYYSGDFDLLVNISKIGSICNIPKPLLKYRIHKSQISVSKNSEQIMYANQIRLKQLSFFDVNPSIDEILLHLSLMNELVIPESQWEATRVWCRKLIEKNKEKKLYFPEYLYHFLQKCFYICKKRN